VAHTMAGVRMQYYATFLDLKVCFYFVLMSK